MRYCVPIKSTKLPNFLLNNQMSPQEQTSQPAIKMKYKIQMKSTAKKKSFTISLKGFPNKKIYKLNEMEIKETPLLII